MASWKVEEAGFLTDRRGAFFLVEISREELYALFGPETYGHFRVQASPIASLKRGAEFFQQWAQEGGSAVIGPHANLCSEHLPGLFE